MGTWSKPYSRPNARRPWAALVIVFGLIGSWIPRAICTVPSLCGRISTPEIAQVDACCTGDDAADRAPAPLRDRHDSDPDPASCPLQCVGIVCGVGPMAVAPAVEPLASDPSVRPADTLDHDQKDGRPAPGGIFHPPKPA